MMPSSYKLSAVLAVVGIWGCYGEAPTDEESQGSVEEELGTTQDALSGRQLFDHATFGGNGRTCETCHSKKNGTLTPEQVEHLYRHRRNDPLFRSIDSDDGAGNSYTRLRTRATIRVTIPLPPNITLADDPTATEVTFERGIPTTTNIGTAEFLPNEDGTPLLMYDFRRDNLEDQAFSAIQDHYQPTQTPTANQLAKIADFQREDSRFYSSNKIKRWVNNGGDAPELPRGHTPAQKRGRKFFEPGGRCEGCHSGPMLNQTTEAEAFFQPVGSQHSTAFAGELLPDQMPQEFREWLVWYEPGEVPADICESFVGTVDQEAGYCSLIIPDPGRMLISGDILDFGRFKIPPLWGVNDTAPYFHDNSAPDLEAVMRQYDAYFTIFGAGPLPPQDQADIIAFMKLL